MDDDVVEGTLPEPHGGDVESSGCVGKDVGVAPLPLPPPAPLPLAKRLPDGTLDESDSACDNVAELLLHPEDDVAPNRLPSPVGGTHCSASDIETLRLDEAVTSDDEAID